MPAAENVQRVGFLAVVPGLLRDLGVEPAPVLEAAGLDPHALDDREGTIPYAAMGRLLAISADRAACPHFGLLLGQRISAASLGLIGELMRNAPTLGVAMRDLAIHQHRHARGAIAYLLARDDYALFGYAIYQRGVVGHAQIYDAAAAAAFNIVRGLVGSDELNAAEALLSRDEPADTGPYRRYFGAKLHFNADQTGVLLPGRWLDRRVTGADAMRRKSLETQIEAFWRAGDFDIVTRVRRTLRIGLLTGEISGDDIAAQLAMARRTLLRRLVMHGVTFQDVLDETRFEFARQLLVNTRLTLGDIGLILRFADPSVFTRAFLRWSGMTPSDWRTQRREVVQADSRLRPAALKTGHF